jgi:hypothetical protein
MNTSVSPNAAGQVEPAGQTRPTITVEELTCVKEFKAMVAGKKLHEKAKIALDYAKTAKEFALPLERKIGGADYITEIRLIDETPKAYKLDVKVNYSGEIQRETVYLPKAHSRVENNYIVVAGWLARREFYQTVIEYLNTLLLSVE